MVTLFSNGGISKFDPFGDLILPSPFFPVTFQDDGSESIVQDNDGNYYVGHADGLRDVIKFSPEGILLDRYDVATSDRGSDWIDLAADQTTLFYTSEDREVFRYDFLNDVQLPNFANDIGSPSSLCKPDFT